MVYVATKFIASDGKEFDTKEEAEDWEERHQFDALVGLTKEEVYNIVERNEPILCDLVERLAHKIAKSRRAAGEFKRKGPQKPFPKEPGKAGEGEGQQAA